jgi:hypothetical protein
MSSLREASWEDTEGRKWAVLLPESALDSEAALGIPVGPPSLESLALPIEVEVRLHNQLFDRRLLTTRDVKNRPADVMGALLAALKVDKQRLIAVYSDGAGGAEGAGSESRSLTSKGEPDTHVDHRGPGGPVARSGLPGERTGRRPIMATGRHHAHPGTIAR